MVSILVRDDPECICIFGNGKLFSFFIQQAVVIGIGVIEGVKQVKSLEFRLQPYQQFPPLSLDGMMMASRKELA